MKKYTSEYLAKQLYFICDKRVEITADAKLILTAVNKLNILMQNEDQASRVSTLFDYLDREKIKICIPCLLAYEENKVYSDPGQIYNRIQSEVDSIKKYYLAKRYPFERITPEIVFCIFPIESIDRLRDKEHGFYAGLC